jgi:hypothetical protein
LSIWFQAHQGQLQDGQLDDAPITLKELETITQTFLFVWAAFIMTASVSGDEKVARPLKKGTSGGQGVTSEFIGTTG